MDQVRKSKIFQRNFLSHQQKILLKFDYSNIIGEASASEKTSEIEEILDIDEQIAANLNSTNGLVVMFTLAKLYKILQPLTE